MKKILVVGAHYDDAELGCAGTMAKVIDQGGEAYKITLTDNVTVSKILNLDIDYESSKKDSANACGLLGVTELDFETVACNELRYNTKTMQSIEAVIFELQIDTVFIHFEDDYNQDHVEAYKICKTAARHCKNILLYQSNAYVLPTPYYPSVFVDISQYAELKRQALFLYQHQHNRFDKLFETTMDRNRTWGYATKTNFSEGFHPLKITL